MATNNTGESFGEMIDRFRQQAGMKQEELAKKLDLSGATLSRLKRSEIPLKPETGLAIIEALGLKGTDKKAARTALFEYVENFELPSPYIESGMLLKELIDQHGIRATDIASHIKTSPTFVSAWWGGSKTIPSNMFNSVYKFLIAQGVPRNAMENFKRLYTKDVIINNSQLDYLTHQQRKRLAELAMTEVV